MDQPVLQQLQQPVLQQLQQPVLQLQQPVLQPLQLPTQQLQQPTLQPLQLPTQQLQQPTLQPLQLPTQPALMAGLQPLLQQMTIQPAGAQLTLAVQTVPRLPQQTMADIAVEVEPEITTVPLPPQTPGAQSTPPESPGVGITGVRLESPIMSPENVARIELPTISPVPGQGTVVYPIAIPTPDVKESVPLAQAYSAQQRAVQGRIDIDPSRVKAEKSKPGDGSYNIKDLRRIAGELNIKKSSTKKELAAKILEAITKP